MKLTVIGGGGFRAPILAKSLALGAHEAGITQLVFMDIHSGRLQTYGKLALEIIRRINPHLSVTLTQNAREALRDADFIITTIRPGAEEGRSFDERSCLDHGVLGQETTGAGGYAMALRSIPAIAEYCSLAHEIAPGAEILNFTNPSGLVTQAMRDLGYHNVYGICDAPTTLFHQLEDMLGANRGSVFARSYGLNHLSWFDQITLDGKDCMQEILSHPDLYSKTDAKLFGPQLIAQIGNILPNEYLYFWYFQKTSLLRTQDAPLTRGETIARINREMYASLCAMDIDSDFSSAFACYMDYLMQRENSYFAIETGETQRHFSIPTVEEFIGQPDGGGYAGVALQFIKAKTQGSQTKMVLSIPNCGSIPELADTDVAELSCVIDRCGVTPVPARDISQDKLLLLRTVKAYENLAVRSVLENNLSFAEQALTIHPLVADYDAATKLVQVFHRQYNANFI